MNPELLKLLRCPTTGQALHLESPDQVGPEIRGGFLVSTDGSNRHPIRDFIPRFVPASNYADNFGLQWNHFRQTQLDSYSGTSISADRFWNTTAWKPKDLAGKWVLDCGCGSGRFAEVALSAGAKVVALDYSSAVDACYANLSSNENLHAVQGDIYQLPFAPGSFSFVFSLGVLQHTPDVGKAFAALPPMVEHGGQFCADFYEMTWKHRLLPRHFLRPVTTRMAQKRLFAYCERLVPPLLSMSQQLGKIPAIGRLLVRAMPVADYTGLYPLDQSQLREWAVLDTFDWLSPAYDQPQKRDDVKQWISAAGFDRVDVLKAGFMAVRGIGKQ